MACCVRRVRSEGMGRGYVPETAFTGLSPLCRWITLLSAFWVVTFLISFTLGLLAEIPAKLKSPESGKREGG